MYTKTITYTDYDGNEHTEDFLFNLNKNELMMMNFSVEGGLQKHLEWIMREERIPELMQLITDIVVKAYGEKSLDGKHFMKNAEISEAFTQTEAYSELMYELLNDPDELNKFIRGIVPAQILAQADAQGLTSMSDAR